MAYKPKRKISLEESTKILTGGDEPTVTKEFYQEQLTRALNWYNANREEKDYRAYADYYVKHSPELKEYAYAVSKASFLEVRMIGVIGRLIRRQQHVDIADTMKVLERLVELGAKYKKVVAPKAQQAQSVIPAPSIQDRIIETARTHAAEVEGAIDEYITNGTEFSMKSYLLGNQVSGVVAKKIGTMFERRLAELEEAQLGKCPQLKEAYGHYTKRGLRQFTDFIRQIIADCNQQVVSAKAQRKPRARKVKPAAVVAKNIQCMREFPELGLKSIAPEKIIGATELWVYNTATRKLIWFKAADSNYLGVSGMSITNYDVQGSEVKTLRKPEEFFKKLTSTGKRAMANAWKAINAKTSSPRSRINETMILLAAN